MSERFDPVESLANARHEFGEHGGVNMCIEASTTFTVLRPEEMPTLFEGLCGPQQGRYLYGRHFNPTVYALSRQLAALEGTESAYCAASGMGAISAAVTQLCEAGDEMIVSDTIYGGTHALFHEFLPKRTGLRVKSVDVTDLREIETAFTDRTRLLYVETVSNPTLVVADLPRLAEIAHRHGVPLVVDNTFTPMIVSPARHGADIVIHSLTKFISGSSDIIGGVICADDDFICRLMDVHDGALMLLGSTMDPNVAFHVGLRLPHLAVRMAEHSRRAQIFAVRMTEFGIPVSYPGLASHPQHDVFSRLRNHGFGFGGMLCIDLQTQECANAFMDILQNDQRFGFIAVSLGYFDNLMSVSASSTSSELSDEERARSGISPGMVRLSVGYTGNIEQRWKQLESALRKMGLIGTRRIAAG